MSDKLNTVVEVAKVMVQPAMKVLDMLDRAIGIVYKPHHMKKLADAEAYKVRTVGSAISETGELSISYKKHGITMSSMDTDDFLVRSEHRALYQQVQKQKNIEAVAAHAYDELENHPDIPDTKTDEDWETRFFRIVEDISSEKMQIIWGKILAGEIKHPGSFSLRTLDLIRNLSTAEAETFQKFVPLITIGAFKDNGVHYIISDEHLLSKYDVRHIDVLKLDECGLITSSSPAAYNLTIFPHNKMWIRNDELIMLLNNDRDSAIKISMKILYLTEAGIELYNLLAHTCNRDFIYDYSKWIVENNKEKVRISVHDYLGSESGSLNYTREPDYTFV